MDTNYKRQIWVAAFCAAIADREASIDSSMAFADLAVMRCGERFPKREEVNPFETGVIDKDIDAKGIADEVRANGVRGIKFRWPMRQVRDAQMAICSKADLDSVNRDLIDAALSHLCVTGQVHD